jgi:transposase-like protein
LQTGEGELEIQIPQARHTTVPFVSKLFPKWHCKRLFRTDPLKTLVIGGFVRGLSMRDIESLCEEVGLGKISRSTVARICAELHERFEAFKRRSLYDTDLVVLFLDAIFLPVRPSGPKEGVICAWGIDERGRRQLVAVQLGARESKEDWLELGRDLMTRGLAAPRLVVADGAPGLISAIGEIWPRADRQHCCVHRLRNLLAKLPKDEQDRVRFNYWAALTDATSANDGKLRLQVLISELEHRGYESAARCLAEDLDALVVHLRYPLRHRERWRSTNLLERSLGEVRRRTKVMGRFPGESSCLSLVFAVLDLFITHASNGATFTALDRQHLYRIKYRQLDPDTLDQETTAA